MVFRRTKGVDLQVVLKHARIGNILCDSLQGKPPNYLSGRLVLAMEVGLQQDCSGIIAMVGTRLVRLIDKDLERMCRRAASARVF